MSIHESSENYLEQLLLLSKQKEKVRAVDLCAALGFSRPTVSVMLRELRAGGFVIVADNGGLLLTEKGEALLACLYAYSCSGDEDFRKWFEKLDDWTWARYPDPAYGEWFAYLDRQGNRTHTLKGGKWKTFFHVPRCLLFAAERMKKIDQNMK